MNYIACLLLLMNLTVHHSLLYNCTKGHEIVKIITTVVDALKVHYSVARIIFLLLRRSIGYGEGGPQLAVSSDEAWFSLG
jgi:hypothetical protein